MKNMINRLDTWLDTTGERLKQREWNVPIDLVGGAVFVLIGIVLLVIIPQQITVKKKEIINGQQFPSLLVYLMIGCGLLLFFRELIKLIRHQEIRREKMNLLVEIRALIIFADILIYYFVCKATDNFLIGSCVFVLLMLLFFRCKKWHYYAITLSAAVLIWVAFRYGLNVRF